MKFLFITTKVPYPPDRGDKVHSYNICKSLLKKNEVCIATFYRNKSEIENIRALKKEGFDIEAVHLPFIESVLNLRKAVFSSRPMQVSAFCSKRMEKKISELTSTNKYDMIFFHLIVTAHYIKFVKNTSSLKIMDFNDAITLYLTRYIDFIKNPIKRFIYKIELKRTLRYETIAKEFDTLLVCSQVDQDFLKKKNVHNNIRILLNGVNIETFRYQSVNPEPGKIIFVGNMQYFPNADAVIYFIKNIFPLILNKKPNVKFVIIGKNPSRELLELQNPNIIVKGFVPDLNNEYLSSEVNIAPIRFGAGIPNKIIESLALGIPTVSTELSAGGLPDELRKFVFTANNPQKFADTILSILDNDSIREKLRKEGIKLVIDTLNWDRIVADFIDYVKERIEILNLSRL